MSSGPLTRKQEPEGSFGLFLEWIIVIAICLGLLFVVVPLGTKDTENFGLSPRMVPTLTIAAIAALAAVGLIVDLHKPTRGTEPESGGLGSVLLLGIAAVVGVVCIHYLDLVWGGTILLLLCTLVLGARHVRQLMVISVVGLALLFLVDWSGL